MIDYRILGSIEVTRDGEQVDLGSRMQRAVLALLLLRPNQPVPTARLIDELWYEPPATAPKILQNCVMRLRRLLLEGTLLTRDRAYELQVAPGDLDVDRFSRLLTEGREALRREEYQPAFSLLERAIAEWRGAPLRDLGDLPFVEEESRRLEGLWLGAVADRIDAALALGRHAEVVDELQWLVREHPLHERMRAQLMLALYRSGRQTESLEAYREGRRILVQEIGVEPGAGLRQLEQEVLRQDPALDRPVEGPTGPASPVVRVRRFSALLAALAVGVAATFAAVGLIGNDGAAPAAEASRYSVAIIDSKGRHVADLPVGSMPSGIAIAFGGVWVLNHGDSTLTLINARYKAVMRRAVPVGSSPVQASVTSIAVADVAVWAVDSVSGSVTRVAIVAGTIDRFALPPAYRYTSDYLTLAAGAGRLWITSDHFRALFELDPKRGRVLSRVALPGPAVAAASSLRSVWCITTRGSSEGFVARVDPVARTVVARIPLPGAPTAVATGFGAVWVAMADRNLLYEIDENTNAVVRTIPVPGGPIAVAVGDGSVWVLASKRRRLVRVDPASGAPVASTPLDGSPRALAVADGRVWVALA